jgi:hypothetical protein
VRRRVLAATALLLLTISGLLGPVDAVGAAASEDAGRQVVLLLVPRSSWSELPARFDGWAKASVAIATANGARRESDVYLTISKGGRASGFGARIGSGPMSWDGERLTFTDWDDFVDHDKDLRYGGDIGTLGENAREAGLTTVAITRSNTMSAMVLADRDGVVDRAIVGGGALEVAGEVRRGTDLIVAETSAAALAPVLDAVGDTCTIVASSSMPRGRRALGALAVSPACGLGSGRLVSATTRQPDYTVVADLLPTTLELLGLDSDVDDEAAVIRPAGGTRTVQELIDRSDRARVTARSSGYFNALGVAAVLLGLFATQMTERWRRRWAAALLALPGSILLIELVPWWRIGVAGGLALAVGTAVVIGALASVAFERRPRLLVGVLALGTALLLGIDASTGGLLQFDSGIANNAIGAGRFSGMGNIPYGFLIAACLLTAGLALDRWGRRAVVPLAVGLAAAVVADGAPTLGADVGGVLAAVPAFAFLLFSWRRPLPLRRLALLGMSGVVVLSVFAAFDVSRPAASRTHLGRTLTNGDLLPTIIRREMAALQSFQRSTWCVVLLVVLVGFAVMWEQLPTTRPLQVMLAAIGIAAFLGTFVNDSGVSVAGAMAAVAWPAHVVLLRPAPESDVSEGERGGTAPRRQPPRSSGSAPARSAR